MRLIQFKTRDLERRIGVVNDTIVYEINGARTMHVLAMQAIEAGIDLVQQVERLGKGEAHDYAVLLSEGRVLVPLDHADPAHCMVSGTGLTHLGSAATRDKMHQKVQPDEETLSDSMRMFKWGVEGGKPPAGEVGTQPEWFFKGDGAILVAPGAAFPVPKFAEDAGEEPEIAGIYIIGPDLLPYRLGFALGNEFSDHVMERRNYLYLAHSKLRFCSFGPELLTGPLPRNFTGTSRISRGGEVLWQKAFASGEDNMSHSLANLEHHHFKYAQFRRQGDVHIHFFGTATLSFADQIHTENGDVFEISAPYFGAPLVNGIQQVPGSDALCPVEIL